MNAASETGRYTAVAIALHWLIAFVILWQIWVGLWMVEAIEDRDTQMTAYQAFQFHKSLGLAILALSLVRLFWRLTHKPPPLPAAMPGWEKFAARATHWAFYAIMIAAPLTGWLYVSFGWNAEDGRPFSVPTIWFGLFEVPHIPGLESLPEDTRKDGAEAAVELHELLAWSALGLLALHVLAALKHHVVNRDDVLTHMLPFLKPLRRNDAAKPE